MYLPAALPADQASNLTIMACPENQPFFWMPRIKQLQLPRKGLFFWKLRTNERQLPRIRAFFWKLLKWINIKYMKNDFSALSFSEKERICEGIFISNGPYWHIYTDGTKMQNIFCCEKDFKTGMWCLAAALHLSYLSQDSKWHSPYRKPSSTTQ